MRARLVKVLALFIVGLALLFFDFWTKAAVYYLLPVEALDSNGLVFMKNFLGIKGAINLTFNTGAAWGLFSSLQIPLLIVRMAVILGMLLYLFFKEHKEWIEWPMLFILVGALGNVADFFLYGSVIDFIQLNFWGYHFPLFNLADALISGGVIWLFIASSLNKRHERRQMDQTSSSSLS